MLIQERLQLVLKMHNLTPSAFADKIGVQRSNISHVLSGRNKPSLDLLEKILVNFPRVNAHWLITGVLVEGKQDLGTNKESTITSKESVIVENRNPEIKKANNIERIVIFYSDATFKEYSTKIE